MSRTSQLVRLSLLAAALLAACASTPPPAPEITISTPDDGGELVTMTPTRLAKTWDGDVTMMFEAKKGSSAAVVKVVQRGDSFRYKECRKMALRTGGEEVEPTPLETNYRTDYDIRNSDRIETFRATIGTEEIAGLTRPGSAVILCETPFVLDPVHRDATAEFVEVWTGAADSSPSRR